MDPASDAPFQKAFRDGLRDLGYIDGKNILLIVRYSNGDPAKYRAIARELVELQVDVLWGEAREPKEATTTIPIVSPTMDFGDPVRTGLVNSFARPGGNLTGPSSQRNDIDPKVLELTKELLPDIKRLCVLFDGSRARNLAEYADTEFRAMAREIGMDVCLIPINSKEDIGAIPRTLAQAAPQAAVVWSSPFIYQHREVIVRSMAHRVPVIGDSQASAAAGAVLTYSVDWLDTFRRSAGYVDRILKGAKPGDLPIEQPTKFKLLVNLKSAKSLKVTVPESILVRADEIIR